MRYISIDVVRGLAILLMIQVHFVDNLSPREVASAWLYDVSAWLGMIPAPLFTFVSGVSYCLWLRKQEAAGRRDSDITKVSVRRGMFLFGAGIAFNVLVWLPEDTFDWDILTLIGTSLILLAFVRKLPAGVLVFLCVVILILSPMVRALGDYSAYWVDDAYEYDFLIEDVLLGYLANGYFPLMPWLIYPFLGFLVGDVVFPPPGRTTPFPWRIVVMGVGLMAVALLGILFREQSPLPIRKHYMTGFTMFPASTEYTVGMLGLSMVSLACLRRWIDQTTGNGRVLAFFQLFSAYSLTVYVLHHMIHLWPLWVYGTWMLNDPTYYWRQAISTPTALALALVVVIACYCLLHYLDRHGRYGFESLMRWICE